MSGPLLAAVAVILLLAPATARRVHPRFSRGPSAPAWHAATARRATCPPAFKHAIRVRISR